MGKFRTKDKTVAITNAPDDLSNVEKQGFLQLVQQNLGEWSGDYADAQRLIQQSEQSYVQRGMRGYGEATDPNAPSVTAEADAIIGEGPETTGKGMIDSFVREALPTAIASTLGLPMVLADKLTEAISAPVAKAMNDHLGTNQLSWKETKERWFDKAGLERPDTRAEQVYGMMGEGVSDAMGMVGAGKFLRAGQGLTPTVSGAVGEQLMYQPLSQTAGAMASAPGAEYGGQAAEALAEKAGAGERGQAAANVAGQFIGGGLADVATGAALAPVERRLQAGVTPLGGREAAIMQASEPYTQDVPLTRSELMRETSQREATKAQKWETRPGGAGEFHYDRYNANQKLLSDAMDDYGIEVTELGRTSRFSEELMNDFLDTRQSKLTQNVDAKKDVITRLTEGGETIPTPQASATIQELIDAEDALGMQGLMGAQGVDSQRNQAMWLGLKADIKDRDFDQLETIRKRYAQTFRDQDMPDDMQQDLRRVYRELVGGYDSDGNFVDGDIGNFILANGEEADYTQWRVANKNLADMANEFGDKALYNLLEEGKKNPENIQWEDIDKLLTSPNVSQTQKLYDRLSPEGQGTAKVAIMSKIFQESNPADLSPTVFAQKVQQYGDNLGIVLNEAEMDELAGLKKFLESTAYSEQFVRSGVGAHSPSVNVMPGTGPLVSHGMRQVGVAGLGVSAAGMGLMGKLAQNSQKPEVRNLMARLAAVDPGSAAEAETIKRIMRVIGATDEMQTGEQINRMVNPRTTASTVGQGAGAERAAAEIKAQENLMRQEERQR